MAVLAQISQDKLTASGHTVERSLLIGLQEMEPVFYQGIFQSVLWESQILVIHCNLAPQFYSQVCGNSVHWEM